MMVSLNDLCLLRVCNAMIDGILPNQLQNVWLSLRRMIFETLIARQKLSDSNCLKYMEDLLFDDNLCAVEALPKESRRFYFLEDDTYSGFLQFLQARFDSLPSVTDRITTLRLAAMNADARRKETICFGAKRYTGLPKDMAMILKLISQCRNLKNLSIVNGDTLAVVFPKWLEAVADATQWSGSSGLEMLELVYQIAEDLHFEPEPEQKLAFKRLKYLRLQNVSLTEVCWIRLLQCCRSTLESLVLEDLTLESDRLIPIKLDVLRSLDAVDIACELNVTDVAELCPKLKRCHFRLMQSELTVDVVSKLKLLLPSLEGCSISLLVEEELSPFLNELIDVAGEKITKIKLRFDASWTAAAVRRLLLGCPNLRTLGVSDLEDDDQYGILERGLHVLLSDKERAERLLELTVSVGLSEETLVLLFTNCINLEMITLCGDGALANDGHLEMWIKRGARPSRVHLESTRASERGLKLLIAASGPNLIDLSVDECCADELDSVFEALIRCCPNLGFISIPGVPDRIRDNVDEFRKHFIGLMVGVFD